MDAFERVVAMLLEQSDYWVRSSFKVDLTKEEKRRIGKPSMPRPEIDLIAYRAGDNCVRAVECKSYLDSGGVGFTAFDGSNASFAKRFKLFNDDNWRTIVESRMLSQLVSSGMCTAGATVRWTLAAGKIATTDDKTRLVALFAERGWDLWDADWIGERLEHVASRGYENDVVSIVAKLLRRPTAKGRARVVGRNGGLVRPASATRVGATNPTVSYKYSRLCFRADLIEPLGDDDTFRVITPEGSFEMTKREFYAHFRGVTETRSYRERGLYHFPHVPRYAEPFRVESK